MTKYPNMSQEEIDETIDKLGGEEGARRFLAGEFVLQFVGTTLTTIERVNPEKFIGKTWKFVEGETNLRAAELKSVDFSKVRFITSLIPEDDGSIAGEDKLFRLKQDESTPLGSNAFLALWVEKEHKTLESFYKNKGIDFIEFYGDVLYDGHSRFVLNLFRENHGGWRWGYLWLGKFRSARYVAICLAE